MPRKHNDERDRAMQPDDPKIGKLAVRGVAWSIVQNWGGRLITFGLFNVLARFLTPSEFGLASAAIMVMQLITLVAGFGFADAVVQRPNLQPADINLPFFVSTGVSVLLAVACALLAPYIERGLDVEGLAPIIVTLSFVAPIMTLALFQEMSYRRRFAFRPLAFRVLIANVIAGACAIACAAAGFGVWSLVVQTYLAAIVGAIWLWRKPAWWPSRTLNVKSFKELGHFGLSIVSIRLLDFVSMRFFEVLLIGRFGIAIFGLYAVGARLYQTLTQLLQTALNDVSLTILSRVSHDRARMGQIYLQAVVIAAFLFAPIFVGAAAVISELSAVLFGTKWEGMEEVARPLLVLGAVQSVQFLNGPYLSARGRPQLVLAIGSLKSVGIPFGLLLVPSNTIGEFVTVFAITQLLGTPVSFWATARELAVPLGRLLLNLLPAVIACAAAYFAVGWARPSVAAAVPGALQSGIVLGAIFVVCYGAVAALIGFRQIRMIQAFIRSRFRRE